MPLQDAPTDKVVFVYPSQAVQSAFPANRTVRIFPVMLGVVYEIEV